MKRTDFTVSKNFLVGLVVFTTSFLLFFFAPIDVSYDYDGYIIAYQSYAELTFPQFRENIAFPYVMWGECGKFEILFAFLLWFLSLSLSPFLGLALVNALFLTFKTVLLRKLGVVSPLLLASMIVTSVTLFEFNAIRAGEAAFFIVLSGHYWLLEKKVVSLLLVVVACLFHVSALLLIPFLIIFLVVSRLPALLKPMILILFGAGAYLFPLVLQFIPSSMVPSKIAEYIMLKEVFSSSGSYNPFNSISIIIFIGLIAYSMEKKDYSGRFYFYIASIASIFYVCFQSVPVIAERVWLVFYLFIFIAYSCFVSTKSFRVRTALSLLLFISISVNYLLRYPHANVFYFAGINYEAISIHIDDFEKEAKALVKNENFEC